MGGTDGNASWELTSLLLPVHQVFQPLIWRLVYLMVPKMTIAKGGLWVHLSSGVRDGEDGERKTFMVTRVISWVLGNLVGCQGRCVHGDRFPCTESSFQSSKKESWELSSLGLHSSILGRERNLRLSKSSSGKWRIKWGRVNRGKGNSSTHGFAWAPGSFPPRFLPRSLPAPLRHVEESRAHTKATSWQGERFARGGVSTYMYVKSTLRRCFCHPHPNEICFWVTSVVRRVPAPLEWTSYLCRCVVPPGNHLARILEEIRSSPVLWCCSQESFTALCAVTSWQQFPC